jgi:small subunit ribosomal protein S10e
MVLVPLKEKVKLYTFFLKEGVFACRKDNTTNNENLQIPNLHCFLIMRSLVSRGMATEIFSWRWHYYFLTKKGVDYLREYLGLPANIVPNTYKLEEEEQPKEEGGEEGEEKKERRDRGERREGGERKGRGRARGGRGGRRGGRRGGEEEGGEPETKEEAAE